LEVAACPPKPRRRLEAAPGACFSNDWKNRVQALPAFQALETVFLSARCAQLNRLAVFLLNLCKSVPSADGKPAPGATPQVVCW
jgi:hypothetical protein